MVIFYGFEFTTFQITSQDLSFLITKLQHRFLIKTGELVTQNSLIGLTLGKSS